MISVVMGLPLSPAPRDPSADEAARELSKQIYQDEKQSVLLDAIDWFLQKFFHILDGAGKATPGGNVGLVVFVVLIAVVIGLVIWKFGLPGRRARIKEAADPVTPTRSSTEHRDQAERLAAEGRYAEAIRERLRGVVADLVARDLVDNRPGRTASEVAAEAGRVLPAAIGDLNAAVGVFGEIWYGGRDATAEHDARMKELALRIREARPGAGVDADAETWAAVQ